LSLQTDNPERVHPPRDPYAAFRHRDYRLYVVGNLVANFGQQMLTIAVGWELYERTRSPMMLGYVGLVQVLPVIALFLPSGHLADRMDRRLILLAGQLLMAVASLGLAAISFVQGPVLLMYLCLLLAGIANAIKGPARAALIPQLVPLRILGNAAAWSSTTFEIACMSGPAVGGAIIAMCHRAWPVYILDAVAALTFFAFVWLIPARPRQRPGEPPSLKTLAAGLAFVQREKVILSAIALDMFAVLLGGATTLLPIYAKDILHVGPQGFGWLRAAPAVGALVMATVVAHSRPFSRAGRALLLAVAGFGAVTIVFGLSRSFLLSLAMLFLAGAFDNISVVIRHTLVQVRTPDVLRGRVSAVNGVFIGSSNELGGFESGLVAQLFGPVVSVVAGGIGTIAVVAAVAGLWPEIRALGSLADQRPPDEPEV